MRITRDSLRTFDEDTVYIFDGGSNLDVPYKFPYRVLPCGGVDLMVYEHISHGYNWCPQSYRLDSNGRWHEKPYEKSGWESTFTGEYSLFKNPDNMDYWPSVVGYVSVEDMYSGENLFINTTDVTYVKSIESGLWEKVSYWQLENKINTQRSEVINEFNVYKQIPT